MSNPTPAPEENNPTGLRKALRDLGEAIEDLTSLEVYTYTGTLTEDLISGQSLNWDEFKPGGKLTLAAATRINADFDTINFQANNQDIDNLQALTKVHEAAVETAQNGRLAIINAFKGFFNLD